MDILRYYQSALIDRGNLIAKTVQNPMSEPMFAIQLVIAVGMIGVGWSGAWDQEIRTCLITIGKRLGEWVEEWVYPHTRKITGNIIAAKRFIFPLQNLKETGLTVIIDAIENDHSACVQQLLRDPTFDPSRGGNKAIRVACNYDSLDIVNMLLNDPRVDPSANGGEAMFAACSNGYLPIVNRLLQDPRVAQFPHVTGSANVFEQMLAQACRYDHLNVVDRLLQDSRLKIKDHGALAGAVMMKQITFNQSTCSSDPVLHRLLQESTIATIPLVAPYIVVKGEEITHIINILDAIRKQWYGNRAAKFAALHMELVATVGQMRSC